MPELTPDINASFRPPLATIVEPQPKGRASGSELASEQIRGTPPRAGDVKGWRAWLAQQVPPEMQGNEEFLDTVMAGAHAESSLDHMSKQPDGDGHGLFQFDTGQGAMGEGLGPEQLFDPAYQASKIIPEYVANYNNAPPELTGADKASWVAGMSERPFDYENADSVARQNYKRSHAFVTQGQPQ